MFAPTDAAFAKIPKVDPDALLADAAEPTEVLTCRVVPERLAPAALPGDHAGLEGGRGTVTGSDEGLIVNGTATVLCGNVQTADANVQIVDTVPMPPR
ncbi:fasciclin domain-containing protein [Kitasatospora sp. NBC_01539]|uniref:fasciclin domain-containing protein n=1 Tax=Kitasatospora sp. NBC_01539 TaxID=2903577 RepID=UPI0038601F18